MYWLLELHHLTISLGYTFVQFDSEEVRYKFSVISIFSPNRDI